MHMSACTCPHAHGYHSCTRTCICTYVHTHCNACMSQMGCCKAAFTQAGMQTEQPAAALPKGQEAVQQAYRSFILPLNPQPASLRNTSR